MYAEKTDYDDIESQINALSDLDMKSFPICRYTPEAEKICGIFKTVEEFLKYKNSMEHLTYKRENGPQYVIYAWNLFSTLLFVQECLKRFGRMIRYNLIWRLALKNQGRDDHIFLMQFVSGHVYTGPGL